MTEEGEVTHETGEDEVSASTAWHQSRDQLFFPRFRFWCTSFSSCPLPSCWFKDTNCETEMRLSALTLPVFMTITCMCVCSVHLRLLHPNCYRIREERLSRIRLLLLYFICVYLLVVFPTEFLLWKWVGESLLESPMMMLLCDSPFQRESERRKVKQENSSRGRKDNRIRETTKMTTMKKKTTLFRPSIDDPLLLHPLYSLSAWISLSLSCNCIRSNCRWVTSFSRHHNENQNRKRRWEGEELISVGLPVRDF